MCPFWVPKDGSTLPTLQKFLKEVTSLIHKLIDGSSVLSSALHVLYAWAESTGGFAGLHRHGSKKLSEVQQLEKEQSLSGKMCLRRAFAAQYAIHICV